MSTQLTERKQQLRQSFIDARGYWNPFWEGLLELDEDFFAAYTEFSGVPWRSGPLAPKIKELIYIAVDAAATHLYADGVRQHVKQAISYGAAAAEIMEVLELTATLGIHACNVGVPILVEELANAGTPISLELSEHQRQLKAEFEEKRGYWHTFWDGVLALDAAFFESYVRFSSVPWVSGSLEPKVKEFIYIAFDVSATHLFVPGLRLHIRNAIGYGATKEEILEIIELASVVGIHSCTVGVPILLEELHSAESGSDDR
jgi:alkylhydroperoxidase/carboxymuconolactone decarboxylase family protein YurZ